MAATATDLPLYHLDADRYDRIVSSGALDGERVELIDGIITEMSPQSPQHALLIRRLSAHLGVLGDRLLTQLPLRVAADSVPEPDLALVAPGDADPHAHPTTALLVVEVAHTSHRLDAGRKSALYARAGVPVYWLVDLPGRSVEVRETPGADGYSTVELYRPGAAVPSPVDGVAPLDVGELFRDF